MTKLIERYRLNAEKCLEFLQTFNDREAKRALLVMAKSWLLLAAQREKTIKAAPAISRPSPDNEPPTPPQIDDPPPAKEPPPLRLNPAKPDDPT